MLRVSLCELLISLHHRTCLTSFLISVYSPPSFCWEGARSQCPLQELLLQTQFTGWRSLLRRASAPPVDASSWSALPQFRIFFTRHSLSWKPRICSPTRRSTLLWENHWNWRRTRLQRPLPVVSRSSAVTMKAGLRACAKSTIHLSSFMYAEISRRCHDRDWRSSAHATRLPTALVWRSG